MVDDLLLLWTMTPRYSGLPVGSVAYGIAKDSIVGEGKEEGLYRWVLSKDVQPSGFVEDDLKAASPKLVLPGGDRRPFFGPRRHGLGG